MPALCRPHLSALYIFERQSLEEDDNNDSDPLSDGGFSDADDGEDSSSSSSPSSSSSSPSSSDHEDVNSDETDIDSYVDRFYEQHRQHLGGAAAAAGGASSSACVTTVSGRVGILLVILS